ncbi:uncharacterized protein LOC143894866 [Temnothorax americanus]|uniref:uncharacterized protein LOC143894866 n=1 Tax=Temnothorax americanus TaxID=1964332 RepID=UPI004067B96E
MVVTKREQTYIAINIISSGNYYKKMPKDLQYLSKRRKNQLISQKIESYRNTDISNTNSGLSSDLALDNVVCVEINTPTHSTSINVTNNESTVGDNFGHLCPSNSEFSSVTSRTSPVVENYEEDAVQIEMEQHTSSSGSNFSEIDIIENQNLDFDENKSENNLQSKLRSWVNTERISHRSVKKLLTILRNNGHKTLPQDVRTLMHTPRISEITTTVGNGSYVHFGLVVGLQRSIEKYFVQVPDSVKLLINCDGMSLSKSSGSQFWPILVSIQADVYIRPFAVGIYHGYSKPTNANEFLRPFVNEMTEIQQNGFFIAERNV